MAEDDRDTQSQEQTKLQQALFFFGPLLASFHVATYIVGAFSVGAVAKWITDQWFPFTRLLWTKAIEWAGQYISLPPFNDVEKDALTTVVFFAPLGLYALLFRKQHPLDGRYRWAAVYIGFFFVLVVGLQLVAAVIGAMFSFENGSLPSTLFGQIIAIVLGSTWIGWLIVAIQEKGFRSKNPVEMFTIVLGVLILIYISAFLVTLTENVFQLGALTAICFSLVVLLAGVSIVRTPYRLSWGLGSLIAFVMSGFAFELAMRLADYIQQSNEAG